MKEKEVLSTKYYIKFNGSKIATDPEYFKSDKEACKYFEDNINTFSEIYNNSTNTGVFNVVKEVTLAEQEVTSTFYLRHYIITVCGPNGKQLYLSCSDNTSEIYFSAYESDSLKYKSKEDADYFIDVYKDILGDYYKEEFLDSMKAIEIKECKNYGRIIY